MHLEVVAPSPALADYVEYYGVWEEDAEDDVPLGAPVLPGVVNGLNVLVGRSVEVAAAGEGSRVQVAALAGMVGMVTWQQLYQRQASQAGVLGIYFRPAGFFHLFGAPMAEATDPTLAVGRLAGQFAHELIERISQAETNGQRLAAADELLLRQLHCQQPMPNAIDLVADRILHQHGQVNIEALAHDAGLSRRQLERRFLTEVGAPPKLYARIVRFNHVLQLLAASPAPSWQDIAYRCGYYDQAHFIREFRFFTGKSPSNYSLVDSDFAHFFWAR
ncbi:helix-turn-helix domain-containing protein [Hymenobacter sp. HMF4947]|uniref:Helix-turn-helix domain-containing protein n=1 Tax=Hymenobacter ginkgonis TaxID=2682976 RepID=A0A7K1T9A6_9BACT|nr:AraC family transcriptional regulator [Hymenobacter ginkgonis]MVN74994.1 helix-turn-helix domain-containing protein [Hymenobacter ginkgonis]